MCEFFSFKDTNFPSGFSDASIKNQISLFWTEFDAWTLWWSTDRSSSSVGARLLQEEAAGNCVSELNPLGAPLPCRTNQVNNYPLNALVCAEVALENHYRWKLWGKTSCWLGRLELKAPKRRFPPKISLFLSLSIFFFFFLNN